MKPHTSHLRPDGTTFPPVTPDPPPPPGYVDPLAGLDAAPEPDEPAGGDAAGPRPEVTRAEDGSPAPGGLR